MSLLYITDEALKLKLQGLTVSDANEDARSVPVRYRTPENELADQVFPVIVIENNGYAQDPTRAHSGYIPLNYAPEGYAPVDAGGWRFTETPLPLNVDYTVTLYTRKALHRTALVGAMAAFAYLPGRLGFLEVAGDGTLRRLEVIGGPTLSTARDAQGKRLLTALWRLRTTAELIWAPLDAVRETTAVDLTVAPIGATMTE